MGELLIVLVGPNHPAKESPTDNVHIRVDTSKNVRDFLGDIQSALGVDSPDAFALHTGTGKLPDIEKGGAIDLDKSASDQGLVPPEEEGGGDRVCTLYVEPSSADTEGAAGADEQQADTSAADGGGGGGGEAAGSSGCDPASVAERIFEAIDGLGTDEDAVYASAATLGGQADWDAARDAFRASHPGCNNGDLVQAVKEDLNKAEMEKLVGLLAEKGIALEGGGGGGGDAAAAAGGENGGGGGGGGGEDDDDEMCPECNNLMSQPFCGQSGNAHVRKPKAQAGGPPAECFSSDRLCTQCGDGMLGEEARQAQYVCLDCDGKFCEVCWEHEHRNKKRAGHHQLLLFYDCDLCPHAPAGSSHARAPALWFCDTCRLMMCKQCWFNEHKNRHRRPHQQQFLYPGGEQGPFAASTVEAQTLEAPAGTFDPRPYGVFLPGGGGGTRGACTVCNGDNGLPATYHCDECDPSNPEQLCAVCFETEHRMPHRRGHPKKVLLSECAVCVDHEHRPASLFCRTCDLRLCRACHDIEHRNPLRHGHVAEPLHADVLQDPEAARILDAANAAGDAVPSQRTGEIPYAAALGGGGGVFPAAYAVSASPPRILTPGGGGGAAGLAPYGGAGGVGGGSPTYGAGSLSPGITGVSGFENRGPGGGYMSPSRFDSPIYQQRSGSLREDMTTEELQTFMHYRHRLARFYQVYNPAKLPSVVATLRVCRQHADDAVRNLRTRLQTQEYTGYEEDLMAALARRYGPEPVGAESPLPVGWRLVESTRGDLFFLNGDGRKQWQRPVA